jgi:cation diffusion facilitator CzcD-associated flavoprotein CzcO
MHSADYRTGAAFAGKHALVVGIGNSGAEIATDLVEQGAATVLVAVRSRPPITSREIAGIPVQLFGMALHPFPASLVDRLGKALRRRATGDLRPYGLGAEEWGPFAERRPPVIDVGFLRELKAGTITVVPAVVSFTPQGVVTADGKERPFDVVVAAVGFATGLEQLVDAPGALDERGSPRSDHTADGLFFAGYSETPRGQLFEANRGAHTLAATIDDYLGGES